MKRLLTLLSLTLALLPFFSPPPSLAADDPFPPFSVEGNPDKQYVMNDLFYLFRYIKPGHFKIYENRDRSRDYQNLKICDTDGGDWRDYECSVEVGGGEVDGCDGGDVDICHVTENRDDGIAYTAHSGPVSCKVGRLAQLLAEPGDIIPGKCEYAQVPHIRSEIEGTDFSAETRENASTLPDEEGANTYAGLTFPKFQNEAGHYSVQGTDNPITWGSHYLAYNQCERAVRQGLVVIRAGQTKKTVAETGEWPLGWVDWGYQTQNGKTLLEIRQELPTGATGPLTIMAEGIDDFFLNAGNLDAVSDISESKKDYCAFFSDSLAAKQTWALDVAQAPVYSPSFRQGYVRGSICVWRLCCPGLACPLDDPYLDGKSRDLYYDISISQAFGAALDDLLLNFPLDQAVKIYKKLVSANQLIRFATSASEQAIPPVIIERLEDEISDPCFQYRHVFEWGPTGILLDYNVSDEIVYLDDNKQCPGYKLQPPTDKQEGGAFPDSFLQRIINLFWRGGERGNEGKVDEVSVIKYHLVTMPDAMGQSISEIQNHVYNTRDTIYELEEDEDYYTKVGNIINDNADYLEIGKGRPIADSKRRLAYFSCSSDEYSVPEETSILEYALGTRIGCEEATASDATCDGSDFAALVGSSPYGSLTSQGTGAFESMRPALTPELLKVYAEASEETGVPCEVLAGIHFVEADLNPQGSLVSGRPLGTAEPDAGGRVFSTLLETAIYAGEHLKGKVGGNLNNFQTLTTALSRYNGGGNSNCQQGYPYPIPYSGCPRQFEGEDDPYPVNWIDSRHSTMYLLYCADHTACEPQVWQRPGALTFATAMYENMTKDGAIAEEIKDTPYTPTPPTPVVDPGGPFEPLAPKTCGENSLNTALGCLPYNEELASTLLSFVVGIAGSVSLITMLVATFQIMTAAGDPEKLRKGKELFGSAIMGLLFVIFSVALLRLIAGDIIKLPGF